MNKMKRNLTLLFLSIGFTIGAWAIDQDSDGYYLIGSVQDWQDFAVLVNGGTTNVNARMTADINLGTQQNMVGYNFDLPYCGMFDGQGHTLTINWTVSGEDRAAPFRYANGATIQSLHVDGSIVHTSAYGRCISGIISCSIGDLTTTIKECWSSVSLSGFDTMGGLLSVACGNGVTNITDCIFSGRITTSNSTGCSGGFASHADNSYLYHAGMTPTLNITRGLNMGSFGSYKNRNFSFVRNDYDPAYGTHNVTDCYYKNADCRAQGTLMTAEQIADGTITTALQAGRSEEVWVQDPLTNQPMLKLFAKADYTMPSSGLGTFSAKANFTLPEGLEAYYCKDYEDGKISVVAINGVVPAETGVLLRGTAGETYTLTGTNAEVTTNITNNALVAVTEQTAISQTADSYTNFGLSGGEFKKVNEAGGTVKANRAYLQIPTSALPAGAEARSITLVWDGEATGITDVSRDKENVLGDWYTIDGRHLNSKPAQNGLYVVGGKKVIIK